MSIFLSFSVLAVGYLIFIKLAGEATRPVLIMLFISSCYYGIAGPYYWSNLADGYFLDVYWGDKITDAMIMIIGYSLLYGAILALPMQRVLPTDVIRLKGGGLPAYLLAGLAALSCAYTLTTSISAGQLARSDPLSLVFYQLSDLAIPLILWHLARKGLARSVVISIVAFTLYAVLVGFRYKLILLHVPILFYMLAGDREAGRKSHRAAAVFGGACIAGLFGVMTLTRQKFSGLDFSQLEGVDMEVAMYGLFAESNIMFGLLGIISQFVERSHFIYFEPVVDSILELVPKFMMSRSTGTYLQVGADGLVSQQASQSGTAYPYFAEYLSMGGHLFAVVAVVVVALLVRRLARICLAAGSVRPSMLTVGAGLLAVFFGYFNYSRGYLPASVKIFIIVVAPYFWLVRREFRASPRRIRSFTSQRTILNSSE